jgi:hypothetical protein
MAEWNNFLTSTNHNYNTRKVRWTFHLGEKDISKVEETPRKGKTLELKENKFVLYIGPIKENDQFFPYCHRLGMLYCKDKSLTRGQAREALAHALEIKPDVQLSFLIAKPNTYLDYAWNSSNLTKSEPEERIIHCIDELQAEGFIVTSDKLKSKIRELHGVHFVVRNKTLIDEMLRSPEFFTETATVNEKVNHEENFINVLTVTNTFCLIIDRAIRKNSYITTHKNFQNLSNSDINLSITMLAILPMIAKRKEIPDNLPGLYFYGLPSSGKSFFFHQSPSYHKVACDAPGVARYHLQAHENGFLLNDISAKIMNDCTNSSTLRSLTLGGVEPVKIRGDTQNVQGFVVCTSNDMPDFIQEISESNDENTKANYFAWKRRFITLKFTDFVDEDPRNVNFGLTSTREALKYVFDMCYGFLGNPVVKEMFSKYHEAIKSIMSPDYSEKFATHQKVLYIIQSQQRCPENS